MMCHRLSIWICLAATSLGAFGCGATTLRIGGTPPEAPVTPTVVDAHDGWWVEGRVAIVEISGTIQNGKAQGFMSESENPVGVLRESLNACAQDPSVKAVILRINSPGGTVTASDAMYREVQRFKADTGKPVIAMMMDVAASGGYYVACAADQIIAYPTTITGSIGVIMQTMNVRRGLGMIGIETQAITSGPNKAAGSPFEQMTPEQLAIFQQMVDDFYRRFKGIVREARPGIPADQFDTVTDGRIFTGDQAVKLKLVDRTGDIHDAFAFAKQLAGLHTAHLVLYKRQGQFARTAYAQAPASSPGITLGRIDLSENAFPDGTGVFLYLWRP